MICQTAAMPIRFRFSRHPTAEEVHRDAIGRELTYVEVGASLEGRLPDDYQHVRSTVEVGVGEEAFASGCAALRAWAAHEYLNISVTPERAPLETGVVVVAGIPMGPVTVFAPCRIVSTIVGADRFGFAYGTLPGHPERGEEAFVVRWDPDDVVRFEVAAFSRPSARLVRLGGPLSRWVQRRATRGYLEGVRRFVATSTARGQ